MFLEYISQRATFEASDLSRTKPCHGTFSSETLQRSPFLVSSHQGGNSSTNPIQSSAHPGENSFNSHARRTKRECTTSWKKPFPGTYSYHAPTNERPFSTTCPPRRKHFEEPHSNHVPTQKETLLRTLFKPRPSLLTPSHPEENYFKRPFPRTFQSQEHSILDE